MRYGSSLCMRIIVRLWLQFGPLTFIEGSQSFDYVLKLEITESDHSFLVDSDGDLFYTRSSHGIKQINRHGQATKYCQIDLEEVAVVRNGRVFGCNLARHPGYVCSLINCSATFNASMYPSSEPFRIQNDGSFTDMADESEFTMLSFNCSSDRPMAVTVETQRSTNIAVLHCPAPEERAWNRSRHRLLYSFLYADERYILSSNDESDGTSSTELIALERHKEFYTWRVQSKLSCLAPYHSVVHNYTCATAAVMVSALPDDTLYVAFYHNKETFSCRSALSHHESGDTAGEGATVVCAFPMSHTERNIREKARNILSLNRTLAFQLKSTKIDEIPVLLVAEHTGFYLYSIADSTPQMLRNKPAYGSWSNTGSTITKIILTDTREIVVATNSSILLYDIDACSKRSTCDDCISSNQKYCGWCVLEKRCSTLHGCPSAVKYDEALYGLWLHAKRNNHCPRLTPGTAGTTVSRKGFMASAAQENSGFPISGSHFPVRSAYVDDFSCRMTISSDSGHRSPFYSAIKRLQHPHDELHAEFLCDYPNEILTIIGNASSYLEIRISIAVTLSYTQKTHHSIKATDLKTFKRTIVLCEAFNCVQCAKEPEACKWNALSGACESLLQASPEESSKVEHRVPYGQLCSSSEAIIQTPRIIRIHSNRPTILPRNFSNRSIMFFGENLDILNTTVLDTSFGSCAIQLTSNDRDNVTCIMSGEFVRENVSIRFYTDNGTIVCSGCGFRLFDVETTTTRSTTETCTENNVIQTRKAVGALNSQSAEHFRMDTAGTTTSSPGLLASSSLMQYLLTVVGATTGVLLIILAFLVRLHCITRKGDRKMHELRERAGLLIQDVQGPIPPPRPPRIRIGSAGDHNVIVELQSFAAQESSVSVASSPQADDSEAPESVYETSR